MKKSFLINIALLSISAALTFLFIEVLFRIFYPQSGYSITYAPWGWTHVPNSTVLYYKEIPQFNINLFKRPHAIPVTYNSKGLREFEYNYEKNRGTFRILVLGDSYAEDMGSFFENLHTKWLERKLNDMGYPYRFEVINAGHYAFDNANEFMFYLKEGKRYSPDMVIVMYTGDTASPEYVTARHGEPVLHYKEFTRVQKDFRMLVSWIRRHSHAASFVLNQFYKVRDLKDYLIKKGLREPDKPVFSPGVISKQVRFSDADKAIWRAFRNESEKEKGVFIFMDCGYYPDDPSKNVLSEESRAFLTDNGILLLEIPSTQKRASALKNEELRTGQYNKYYDSHRFGYKMNERVADYIIEFLLRKDLLPQRL